MEKVIGIDLGTTNSCVAIVENGVPTVIPNRGGYKTTPSMVAITEAGKRLVGHIAKRQAITNAENTVYAAKRLIGRKWNSPQVKNAVATSSYRIVQGPHNDVRIVLRDKEYSVSEVSAMVLQEMKLIAEDYLGETDQQGGHHGPRVLQRQPAAGHQGRRRDCRPRRHPHHQRAHRSGAVVRLRQERREDHRRLRFRRRHVRHLDPRDRLERRLQGHRHRGRHVPRRRRRRRSDHRLARARLQGGARDRPPPGPDGSAAPQGRCREGQVRALERARDGGKPPLHHLERAQRGAPPAAHDRRARRSRSSPAISSSGRSTSASRRCPTRASRRTTSRRSSSSAA